MTPFENMIRWRREPRGEEALEQKIWIFSKIVWYCLVEKRSHDAFKTLRRGSKHPSNKPSHSRVINTRETNDSSVPTEKRDQLGIAQPPQQLILQLSVRSMLIVALDTLPSRRRCRRKMLSYQLDEKKDKHPE